MGRLARSRTRSTWRLACGAVILLATLLITMTVTPPAVDADSDLAITVTLDQGGTVQSSVYLVAATSHWPAEHVIISTVRADRHDSCKGIRSRGRPEGPGIDPGTRQGRMTRYANHGCSVILGTDFVFVDVLLAALAPNGQLMPRRARSPVLTVSFYSDVPEPLHDKVFAPGVLEIKRVSVES